jgi:hypothetical protein
MLAQYTLPRTGRREEMDEDKIDVIDDGIGEGMAKDE